MLSPHKIHKMNLDRENIFVIHLLIYSFLLEILKKIPIKFIIEGKQKIWRLDPLLMCNIWIQPRWQDTQISFHSYLNNGSSYIFKFSALA